LEPVSLYLINDDKIINLKKEFYKVKNKSLVITSTDKFITVKHFKTCPNMITKMLYEQPFAEIVPYRYYLDDDKLDLLDYNTKFFVYIKDKNQPNNNIGKLSIRNDNMVCSYQFPSVKLKQEDMENAEKIENKVRKLLPDKYSDCIIEIKENRILNRDTNAKEFDLIHYNWLQTQYYRILYKINLKLAELKNKNQK